ncbi:LysR family transcriptional regulator [Spongiibacter sp. KMU-158]|uniref:LysR family transcriptional regulator n=1 Tax=Spongiibacter pelagi TaxID=2760804 RepID=A0A927GW95_9GAMM|nr:LysR substrate-binding domain-containing protein [Spongiibacter pelagi]MBD2858199.1 LysR family transcriptional regulator [Spongiibacter pelagi]
MRYTLRQLEIFLAVARYESVSKAAKALNLSQSAASAALQSLESQYGLSLFDRHGNRLSLNPIGRGLRLEAETLFNHCREFEQSLLRHGELGHLRIGASFTIGNHLVVRYLPQYLEQFPEAEVELETANTPEVVAKVLNYEVDLGMIEREIHHRDLELIPWREDELQVFCASDHPLAEKKKLNKQDILDARWILREADSGARYTFDRAMDELLPKLNIFQEFRHNEAIKSAVESGLGIGCLSSVVLARDFSRGSLVPLELPQRNLRRRFYFALPRKRHHRTAVERWIQLCSADSI